MRQPRAHQFDPDSPPWIHAISRCVRRAFLCGEGYEHRKEWIERRLRILARCFAVDVGAYAIMSNHIHMVVRPSPNVLATYDAETIARAWWHVRNDVDPFDGLDVDGEPVVPSQAQIDALTENADFVATWRQRLGSLSWFMKELKEPLSRRANREDDCTGAFWEGRFKSVPLLDLPAIMTCMAYVDLNPIRAQLAESLATSDHTSVKERIAAACVSVDAPVGADGADGEDSASRSGDSGPEDGPATHSATVATAMVGGTRECGDRGEWLTPVRQILRNYDEPGDPGIGTREYLALVEATGRVMRAGKRGAIPASARSVLDRLDLNADAWLATVGRPRGLRGSALGRVGALATEAARRGLSWLQVRCAVFARAGDAATAPPMA